MIDPDSYFTIYLIFVSILTFVCSDQYSKYSNARLDSSASGNYIGATVIAVIFILFIGLRPKSGVFIDMMNYDSMYRMTSGNAFEFDYDANNYIFDNFFAYFSSNSFPIELFFLIIAALYFGGIYVSCKRLFPNDTLYAFVIYAGAFSTFSYATNGIKAGAAASIFLWAIGYYDRKLICALLMLVSLGFHHSMVLPITAFGICWLYRNPKSYLVWWVLSLFIAAAHITFFQSLFGGIADESGALYLTIGDGGYRTAFRLDFIIYSSIPVFLGYYIINTLRYRSKIYNLFYCTYLLTNSVWMLCMYASFTNRIAYLSWFMLPIVLIYPFFDKAFVINQYGKLNIVAWCHLGFTIMMQVVYYGFIK